MTRASEEVLPALLRLRISLLGIKPTPWRRIEVAADTTLAELHAVIQAAMGWRDVHLHHFRILGRQQIPSMLTLPGFAWPTFACAPASALPTSTTTRSLGNTSCGSRRCRSRFGRPALSALHCRPTCLLTGVVSQP